ncbi:MAG: PorV/PorQ family protein [Candidatus Eisenbacteria bacterium]|nr:PorV/PorQ family protein [Candidatus Eisenbacteria bacterium]
MRTLRLCTLAALVLSLATAGAANAGIENAGTTAANFLALGANARTLAMGGATLGFGSDLGASSWNAAALGWVESPALVLSHAGLANSTLQEWAGFGGRMGASDMRWAVTGLYQGDGSFEGRDATGASTGTFSASDMAIGGMLARQFGENVTVGFGAKFVDEKLATATGWGVTFDGGLMMKQGPFGLGIAAQNLGGQMHYANAVYRFPSNVGAGVSWTDPNTGLRLAVDANFPSAYYRDVRAGVEWMWHDMLALRAGYRAEMGSANDALSGPTFGVGGGRNGMWMDYGYLLSGNGEGQHRLGLRMNLGHVGDSFGQHDTPTLVDRPKNDPNMIGPPVPKPSKKH